MHYHLMVGDEELYGNIPAFNVTYEALGSGVTDFIKISRTLVLADRDQQYFDEYRDKITKGMLDSDSMGWMVSNGCIKVALLACGGCQNWYNN